MLEFKDILGHEQIKEHFQNAAATGKVSHAYILSGEEGMGKKTLANAFAMTLLCEEGGREPCMQCHACKQVLSGNHPDLIYVTHEKPASMGVDDIREQLINDITIKPYSSAYKIYIIPDANKMTEQAQNALLKTIEEPPEYAVILLITENSKNLLDTIQSRCITLNTRPLTKAEIKEYLIKNLQMDEDQADIAAAFCQGNVGKAIHFSSDQNFQEMKAETLSLLKQIDKMDVPEIMQQIKSFSQRKSSMDDYLDLMLLWYRDVLMFKITKDTNILLYREEYKAISEQACIHNYQKIENIIKAIDNAKVRLAANVNFDITIELLLLTIKEN